jgi:hypothetical protein
MAAHKVAGSTYTSMDGKVFQLDGRFDLAFHLRKQNWVLSLLWAEIQLLFGNDYYLGVDARAGALYTEQDEMALNFFAAVMQDDTAVLVYPHEEIQEVEAFTTEVVGKLIKVVMQQQKDKGRDKSGMANTGSPSTSTSSASSGSRTTAASTGTSPGGDDSVMVDLSSTPSTPRGAPSS